MGLAAWLAVCGLFAFPSSADIASPSADNSFISSSATVTGGGGSVTLRLNNSTPRAEVAGRPDR